MHTAQTDLRSSSESRSIFPAKSECSVTECTATNTLACQLIQSYRFQTKEICLMSNMSGKICLSRLAPCALSTYTNAVEIPTYYHNQHTLFNIELTEKLASDRDKRVVRPFCEPVYCAAINQGREHPQPISEGVTDWAAKS
jgi:hypothetical protein